MFSKSDSIQATSKALEKQVALIREKVKSLLAEKKAVLQCFEEEGYNKEEFYEQFYATLSQTLLDMEVSSFSQAVKLCAAREEFNKVSYTKLYAVVYKEVRAKKNYKV